MITYSPWIMFRNRIRIKTNCALYKHLSKVRIQHKENQKTNSRNPLSCSSGFLFLLSSLGARLSGITFRPPLSFKQ